MIGLIAGALVLILAVTIFRWIVSIPLLKTLLASIDCWADSAQGRKVGVRRRTA